MSGEQKFWLGIWGMIIGLVVVLIVCITFNAYGKRDKWEKTVSNGADPMVVACALGYGDYASTAICTILAQGRK